jgi:hypothetical protein
VNGVTTVPDRRTLGRPDRNCTEDPSDIEEQPDSEGVLRFLGATAESEETA